MTVALWQYKLKLEYKLNKTKKNILYTYIHLYLYMTTYTLYKRIGRHVRTRSRRNNDVSLDDDQSEREVVHS